MEMKTTNEVMINPALPRHWFAIHTRSRHEKVIAARLDSQETEIFLPLHRTRNTWKNGVHADVDQPIFPCYLFARIGAHDRLRLLQTPGVLGLAATTTRPTPIPDVEIDLLRSVTATLKAEPHPYLNCGDRVRIIDGALAGLEGILTRRKNEYRVVLSVEAIMRSIAVEVSEFDIEPVERRK
jgi:transcription antitermination factor NusG